jgi:hypothetical protein
MPFNSRPESFTGRAEGTEPNEGEGGLLESAEVNQLPSTAEFHSLWSLEEAKGSISCLLWQTVRPVLYELQTDEPEGEGCTCTGSKKTRQHIQIEFTNQPPSMLKRHGKLFFTLVLARASPGCLGEDGSRC